MESGVEIAEPEISLNISFGFDDPKYSDRTLQLEIIDDAHTDDNNCSDLARDLKRRRRDDLLVTTTPPVPRVKTIHINSLILAARSSFFRIMFSNGMLESEQKNVTLRIDSSEEVSFMNLLKYVYSNDLPTTLNALLDLSLIADKFEVDSCSRDCSRALQNLPMTCESVYRYLDLPPCFVMSPTVQPLIETAKKFLAEKFKDFDKFKEEVLDLPLIGIQAILSSDDLQVTSECVVYDFVLTWVRKHYLDLEERREILKTHLLHLVRFPFMTTTKLTEEVQTCSDIDPEVASKIVIRALGYKAETPHRRRCLAAEKGNTLSRQFVERAYKRRPNKLVDFTSPHQQCIVYLDLAREELMNTIPGGDIRSETFHLGGLTLKLVTRFSGFVHRYFILDLNVAESSECTVSYKIALRKKPSEEFESWDKGKCTLTCESKGMFLSSKVWEKDSSYFINDVLHVRATLTLEKCCDL